MTNEGVIVEKPMKEEVSKYGSVTSYVTITMNKHSNTVVSQHVPEMKENLQLYSEEKCLMTETRKYEVAEYVEKYEKATIVMKAM